MAHNYFNLSTLETGSVYTLRDNDSWSAPLKLTDRICFYNIAEDGSKYEHTEETYMSDLYGSDIPWHHEHYYFKAVRPFKKEIGYIRPKPHGQLGFILRVLQEGATDLISIDVAGTNELQTYRSYQICQD